MTLIQRKERLPITIDFTSEIIGKITFSKLFFGTGGSYKNSTTVIPTVHKGDKRDRARDLGSPSSVYSPTK